MNDKQAHAALHRGIGVGGATLLGLGSIVGTGVFVSIGTAAGVIGPAALLATALAAVVAACNALSSAQLAASHPVSGGTYEYGYRYLTPWLGFSAGWMFLLAKSASAATAALGFAGYALNLFGAADVLWLRVAVGLLGVVILTAVVLGGIRRSNLTNAVIVAVTLLTLAAFVVVGAFHTGGAAANYTPFFAAGTGQPTAVAFFHATALMFVAYTGYGRIATLGEEVVDPRRTIPRAIVTTLGASAVLYIAVAAVAIAVGGAGLLAAATDEVAAPLEVVSRQTGVAWLPWVLAVGAVTAMLGVLLNLVLGLSRVWLAMGRRGDMPAKLAAVSEASKTPVPAVVLTGVVIAALVLVGDVKTTWTFSAFTVLVYYALTNAAALRLAPADRLYPRFISWAGLVACAALAFLVPWQVWSVGLALLAAGLGWHLLRQRMQRAHAA